MAVEENLNKILKEMWRLDEKLSIGQELHDEERKFYDEHLTTIKDYYAKNHSYWESK